jgi:hypothetical protein
VSRPRRGRTRARRDPYLARGNMFSFALADLKRDAEPRRIRTMR